MPARLELRSVSKRYHGTIANDAVSLDVQAGEIHALVGENGAGKSTLMKIIYGAVQADSGQILWEGEPVRIDSPVTARRLGIGMVYQHFSLFESITVAENIALGLEGRLDLASVSSRLDALCSRYGLAVQPSRLLHHLSVGERQRVEILRCLLQSPRLLILDEPTAVLTPMEAEALFTVLRHLAAEGCSIIYITHRLEEIRGLCSRATVLRAGRQVACVDPAVTASAELAQMMVGSDLVALERSAQGTQGSARLELRSLNYRSSDPFGVALREVSLAVHGGEVLGIAGVSGNGQQELLGVLSGQVRVASATLCIEGVEAGRLGVAARRNLGLTYVPEERLGTGAAPHLSLAENGLLTAHRAGLVRFGLIDGARRDEFARELIAEYDVRGPGPGATALQLSGGNLQKFIVGRELKLVPRVLLVAQPTWGVDVAAATFLRQQLVSLSRRGAAVLVISEDLDELFEICDRIAVISQGRLSAPQPLANTRREQIGLLMAGGAAPSAHASGGTA